MDTTSTVVGAGRRRSVGSLLVLVLLAGLWTAVVTERVGADTPVPTVVHVPTTAGSVPYGSTDAGVSTLDDHGYVQEEYFISGTAAGQAYTTRMLVRRPADPKRFSGTVIAESIRSTGSRSMWALRDYHLRSGHAYVEIASNHVAVNNLVKPSNPARYGGLVFPAIGGGVFGHVMEVIAHGGALLQADVADGPFDGFDVDAVILAGCSEQGTIIRQYMRDGHPVYRQADGSSIFDGYFPACVADWPEPFIIVNGQPLPNFTPGPIEVPVINLTGQSEVEDFPDWGRQYRRADSDLPGDKYRLYEVPGMGHGTTGSSATCPGEEPNLFPAHHISFNALDKLVDWVTEGIAPPRADRLLAESPTGPLVTDEHGNPIGGVRSTAVDVPTASYHTGCFFLASYQESFSAGELAELYPTRGSYVSQVNSRVAQLLREGWILRQEAAEVRSAAAELARSWDN